MNQIAQIQPSRLPVAPAVAKEFNIQPAEWRVLVEQIFPAAKSVESITMALAYCRARKLDIFKKPVHIVPMWSSAKKQMVETVWPGISEIRTTAFRTGEYAGIDEVEFGPIVERTFEGSIKGQNGWEDLKKSVRFPEWAKVTVYRMNKGQRCAFHATVFWEETYATTGRGDVPNEMWSKRPRGQLDKCVEAAALRKAFPEEIGSLYAAEEMEGRTIDGDIPHAAPQQPAPPPPPPEHAPEPEPVKDEIEDAQLVEDETEEAGSDTDFLERLQAALQEAKTDDEIETAWEDLDVDARLTHSAEAYDAALELRNKRVREI